MIVSNQGDFNDRTSKSPEHAAENDSREGALSEKPRKMCADCTELRMNYSTVAIT